MSLHSADSLELPQSLKFFKPEFLLRVRSIDYRKYPSCGPAVAILTPAAVVWNLCRNPSGTWAASAHLPSGERTAVTL